MTRSCAGRRPVAAQSALAASRPPARRRHRRSGSSTRSSRSSRQAIAEKKLPGAVVLVGRGDRILYQKAIGNRALVPVAEPMTLDTIFDLASLTKVVATTTSVMILSKKERSG